ncbi:LmrA/YxaF family transcription factor [Nocardia sp. NPDC004582]
MAADVMRGWIDEGTRYFVRRGLGDADARELMVAVLCALEGAFVLSRTLRSTEPLLAAGQAMAARVNQLLDINIG